MGCVPFAASAVLLALVSTAPEEKETSPVPSKAASRAKGSPVTGPTGLEKFFQLNPEDKFDLEPTNSIHAPTLVEAAHGHKLILLDVQRTARARLARHRTE